MTITAYYFSCSEDACRMRKASPRDTEKRSSTPPASPWEPSRHCTTMCSGPEADAPDCAQAISFSGTNFGHNNPWFSKVSRKHRLHRFFHCFQSALLNLLTLFSGMKCDEKAVRSKRTFHCHDPY